MALTVYSLTKDPTATNLTVTKDPTATQVLVTKQPGAAGGTAYLTKQPGGTLVSVVKNDQ